MVVRQQVRDVLALVREPAGPGPFVLGVDGRSGAGKSELARAAVVALRARHGDEAVLALALEDAYRGWRGLAAGVTHVAEQALAPLARGERGGYRRYDWTAARVDGLVRVPPPDADLPRVVVLEGCGAGSAACAPYVHTLVWLEAPAEVRRRRALARDQHAWVALWEVWEAQESALLTERDARAAADLVLRTG
ncbi:hypothetical protein PU560_13620 [Georgenia sp. 10Sc9-8]|uniref:Uridine kinase n=1 Tax=Georgenia halotolerans TaxID=3028317 RepID=A0ABT5TZS0_9MICO|nr:hypothetical protein [Georgenia halotolerans]